MELSITLIEFVLFVWSAIATALACKYYEEFTRTKILLAMFIEDEALRTKILKARDDLRKHMEGRQS